MKNLKDKIKNLSTKAKLGLAGLSLATLVGTFGGCTQIHLKKVEDLTGDGKLDILLQDSGRAYGFSKYTLFIGQKNGEFVRAEGFSSEYLVTENGEKYFFDGEFYRRSYKQKIK